MIGDITVNSKTKRTFNSTHDLKRLLSDKADQEQVDWLANNKANKQDLEVSLRAVEVLHQKLSLVVVLMLEAVKGS